MKKLFRFKGLDIILKNIIENDFITDVEIYFFEKRTKNIQSGICGCVFETTTYIYYPCLTFKNNNIEEDYILEEDLQDCGNIIRKEHLDFFVGYLNNIILNKNLKTKQNTKEIKKI